MLTQSFSAQFINDDTDKTVCIIGDLKECAFVMPDKGDLVHLGDSVYRVIEKRVKPIDVGGEIVNGFNTSVAGVLILFNVKFHEKNKHG